MTALARRNLRNGLLFASPFILGLAGFTLYPIVASIYLSFCRYTILRPPQWCGLDNYRLLFTEDPLFWKSLYNTLYDTALSLPLGLLLALALAAMLNARLRGMAFYRTLYFLPTIVPTVAVAILWLWVLNPEYGVLKAALALFHIPSPGWLADPRWSKPGLVVMGLWGVGGTMVIFLAGLAGIPQQFYEAAAIDGAGRWSQFRHVTLPMLTPTIYFNLVIGLIGSFQYFTQVYIMTNGGPTYSTLFYALYLYQNAFRYLRMGYASAMAWLLFLLILGATLFIHRTSARWVYYEGEQGL
jgi:multiple sugar transport system permease protein